MSEECVASPLSWCSLSDIFLMLLSVASPLCWSCHRQCLSSELTAVCLLHMLHAMWCYWELTQMLSLEVLTVLGRWCGVAQSISLLLGGHALSALTYCPLCKHLYQGQLSLKCFNIWILWRCKQLMSLQGSEKSSLRSSGLHGISSTLSRLHCYLDKETCNSDSKNLRRVFANTLKSNCS